MSRSVAAIARHPMRVAVLAALALMAVFLIARDTRAAQDVGNFEIDDLAVGGYVEGDVPAAGDVDVSYYSGEFVTGDGPAGDDWAQGSAQDGAFLLSASDPDTAFTNCYGSDIDVKVGFDGTVRFLCDGFSGISDELSLVSPNGSLPDDQWPVKDGSLGVPKDDLSHGYYVQRLQACTGDSSNHTIVIVGMERGNNEGGQKAPPGPLPSFPWADGGSQGAASPSPSHQEGSGVGGEGGEEG